MKTEISNINNIKLEAIRKNKDLESADAAVSLCISAYIATLTDEQAKALINTL